MRSIALAVVALQLTIATASAEDQITVDPSLALGKSIGESEQAIRVRVGFEAAGLCADKKFGQLNELIKRYRDTEERTPSGTWKLAMVYQIGLYLLMPNDPDFEKNWAHIFELGHEWIEKAPSPAPYIFLANAYMNYGWQRSENAHDTKKVDFLAQTRIARQLLEDNKQIASTDPNWYAVMARVAAAQQWPEKDILPLYAEAVKARSNYYETYFQFMDALVPYWKDSALGAVAFAHKAAEENRAQGAKEIYMRVVWHAMIEKFAPYALPVNLPEMHASIEDLVARYPSTWNLNNMAHIACRSGDKPLTKTLIDKMGDGTELGRTASVDISAWEGDPGLFNNCQKWSHDG